jgi:hypothetical protein
MLSAADPPVSVPEPGWSARPERSHALCRLTTTGWGLSPGDSYDIPTADAAVAMLVPR